jgi:hypothetical protein
MVDVWASNVGASWLSAQSCDMEHKSKEAECVMWRIDHPSSIFTTYTRTITTSQGEYTIASCAGPFTTLHDGVVRALCSPKVPETKTIWPTTTTERYSSLIRTQSAPPCPARAANCSLPASACSKLWSVEFTEQTSIFLGQKTRPADPIDGYNDYEWSRYHIGCSVDGEDPCWQHCIFSMESAVQLLYWSTSSQGDDANQMTKGHDRRTLEVYTARLGTHTLVSPTGYVLFPTMSNFFGCGMAHTDQLVPVNPKHILTSSWMSSPDRGLYVASQPLDFAHLAYSTVGDLSYPLVPASVY